jgi:hypothetical protein
MSLVLQPWQLLLMILAGWVNRQQQQVIEYLRTENRVLEETVLPSPPRAWPRGSNLRFSDISRNVCGRESATGYSRRGFA